MKKYAEGELKGILEYTEDPIVSSDVVGNKCSSIFDASATMVVAGNMVKVLSWYDNEWGYSNKCLEMVRVIAK
jgi:glyceraldehyde 3-phosphate dehydrogenase